MLPNPTALPVSRFAIFFVTAILSFFSLSLGPKSLAQETTTQTPPQYRGVQTHVEGAWVTPVPNVPLTAVVELTSTQTLGDGTTLSKKTFNNIARDSQGRIYNERRTMVPETSNETPVILSMHVFDPTTKLNTFMDPGTHVARQAVFDRSASDPPVLVSRPGFQVQDLGTQSMENVVVHGTKFSWTISGNATGTGRPITIIQETWYSDELHLNMLAKHNDPRTGEQTVTITKVERSEPPAEKFEIPADYKILDETPANR
jgi:hypothetical protein